MGLDQDLAPGLPALAGTEPGYTVGAVAGAGAQLATRFGRLRLPTLFLHGTNDPVVPIGESRSWARRLDLTEVVSYDHAGHDVLGAVPPLKPATAIADFVHAVAVTRIAA